eukprot:SAG31_NODE_142_length_22669_cov_18.630040_15_plen_213_part_00
MMRGRRLAHVLRCAAAGGANDIRNTQSRKCSSFRAVIAEANGSPSVRIVSDVSELPKQDHGAANVTISVKYSTLNYKDGMILQGMQGVAAGYPIVPGIDAAGVVLDADPASGFNAGDEVVVTGNKIGQHFDGAYAELMRVRSRWLLPRPAGFSLKESMLVGSAGVTAMQCVMHLEEAGNLRPEKGPVLVNGISHIAYCLPLPTWKKYCMCWC